MSAATSLPELYDQLMALDLGVRMCLYLVADFALLLWTYFVVASGNVGWSRGFRSVPCFAFLLFIGSLFRINDEAEVFMLIHVVTNHLWLAPFKVIGLCLNRGPLVKCLDCKSFVAFTLSLLFPLDVAFVETKVDQSKKDDDKKENIDHPFDDVRFSLFRHKGADWFRECGLTFARAIIKIFLLFLTANVSAALKGYDLPRGYVDYIFLYAFASVTIDVASVLSLVTMNIKLLPGFALPMISQTMGEFWGRRWNLVVHRVLKYTTYEPIIDGSLVARRQYYRTTKPPAWRLYLGILAAFVMSGAMHVFIFCVMIHSTEFPVYHAAFFVAAAVVNMIEVGIKRILKGYGTYDKWNSRIPKPVWIAYSQMVLCLLCYYLHWPDVRKSGLDDRNLDGVLFAQKQILGF